MIYIIETQPWCLLREQNTQHPQSKYFDEIDEK